MTKEDQEHSLEKQLPPSPDALLSFAAISLDFREPPHMAKLREQLVEEKDPDRYILLLNQYHDACEAIVKLAPNESFHKRQIGANLARAAVRLARGNVDLFRADISDVLDEADLSGFSTIAEDIYDLTIGRLPEEEIVEYEQ